tara:strand:+ start:102 stop:281 length:180 start_codon:yes stop_codon:yes gene_type:complete
LEVGWEGKNGDLHRRKPSVSILIQLEVGWEAGEHEKIAKNGCGFNPYSVGSRLGRLILM